MFTDLWEQLQADLQWLDLLLQREILRMRLGYPLTPEEFQGFCIRDEQAEWLAGQSLAAQPVHAAIAELTGRAELMRQNCRQQRNPALPWSRVASAFELTPEEEDLLLLALAPEAAVKYETLYAYLNNDVTRRWSSCDLALRLFAGEKAGQEPILRGLLSNATLFREGLLCPIQPVSERSVWRGSGFHIAPVVAQALLGQTGIPGELASRVAEIRPAVDWEALPLPPGQRARLQGLSAFLRPSEGPAESLLLVFKGRPGSMRRGAAEALCRDSGLRLWHVDMAAGISEELASSLALLQRLHPSVLYLDRCEALFDGEGRPLPESGAFIRALRRGRGPCLLACEPGANWRELAGGRRCLAVLFETPDADSRRLLWRNALAGDGMQPPLAQVDEVARRFDLTPGQIQAAARHAADLHRWHANGALPLFEAARAQSARSLGRLAVRVASRATWKELVVPPATLKRLQEVAAAVRHQHTVYTQWGFAEGLAAASGIKALFLGAPGTGKTLAAGIIAAELGLELYKIDLSGVVSKYIGETEKNLDRIFRAAQHSSAVLFFDEADALFGKRSEVKEAHDRYANIELAYLLQKIEEYAGAVFLASNLGRNIDEAFSRRMQYVIEFPQPDAPQRERLWRLMFPPEAPLHRDVDFGFLAGRFAVTGGDIRSVALAAAFLAAQEGATIRMAHLVRALAQELRKQGRLPSLSDFGPHAPALQLDREAV